MMSIKGHPLAVDPTRPGLVENLPRRSPFPDRMVLFYDPGEPLSNMCAGGGGTGGKRRRVGRTPIVTTYHLHVARPLRVTPVGQADEITIGIVADREWQLRRALHDPTSPDYEAAKVYFSKKGYFPDPIQEEPEMDEPGSDGYTGIQDDLFKLYFSPF